MRAIGRSGLCDSDGTRQFRFAHRQFAEYLAGRTLARLLFHQARSLLETGLGWQAGVAGPLRETAAFAALESDSIAAWVTECDPEVIGLSDVADDGLRKRATHNLLERFRRHELTDAQLIRDGIELDGFQYAHPEDDLRQVLHTRGADAEDVLECAIRLIDSWKLTSMSDDLADVILDSDASQSARESAGYALSRIGTPSAKRRLLPLIPDDASDPDQDLKGLALRCNWPEGLSVSELLSALTPRRVRNYGGAYSGFLFDLERSGFNAHDHIMDGLRWARQVLMTQEDIESTARIARRIAIAALDQIDNPKVATTLADLIVEAAKTHSLSPLSPSRPDPVEDEADQESPFLAMNRDVRRKLIDELAAKVTEASELWSIAHHTPGLLADDDFVWLLKRATASDLTMAHREKYADFARLLRWDGCASHVDAWLAVREIEPITSRLPGLLYVDLDSAEAASAQKAFAEMKRSARRPKRKKLAQPPAQRVEEVLGLCETKDVRFFFNLCNELTLVDQYSTQYNHERFLINTPGWENASASVRQRIVNAAKHFLTADSDAPELARSQPLTAILSGYMPAMFLAAECEPSWLSGLSDQWWVRWTWYILRELRPRLSDEPDQPKHNLFGILHSHAADEVRNTIAELVASTEAGSRDVVISLFDLLQSVDDAALDSRLCSCLSLGNVVPDRIRHVAQFVLSRNDHIAITTCIAFLEPDATAKSEANAVSAAVALLHERTAKAWQDVATFLERRLDLARRVLAEYAHSVRMRREDNTELLTFRQAGKLVAFLLKAFPPESEPVRDVATFLAPEDSARRLRDQLIEWLGNQPELEAVEALRELEREFTREYPWLRRPRARAERLYNLAKWAPTPLRSIAALLSASTQRLIHSEEDAVEGMLAAIEETGRRLLHDSPSDLEDFWNIPTKGAPTPKLEERVSDKLCQAVRAYFRNFAVTADREVQIVRRKLKRSLGGAAGSEVDVLVRIPAAGTSGNEPIVVPIEVKLSHNPEARSGLRDQLVARYMSELGTNSGVFVVAWMKRSGARAYRPLWSTIEAAQRELQEIARECSVDGSLVGAAVINLSLPAATKKKAAGKKRGTTHRKKGRTKRSTKTGSKASRQPRGPQKRRPKRRK